MEPPRNQVVCPRCGKVKVETPPGTVVLPIAPRAGSEEGDGGRCGCGKRRLSAAEQQGD